MRLVWLISVLVVVCPAQATAQGELRFAELGECSLQNGQVIRDCKIGYRTWGTLDEDRSNAVSFPTWFTGTTEGIASSVSPEGLVGGTILELDTNCGHIGFSCEAGIVGHASRGFLAAGR